MGDKHVPTDHWREMVKNLSGFMVPQSDIAQLIGGGIDDKTLRKYYRAELDLGLAMANARVGESLYFQCVGRPAQYDPQTGALLREELKPDKSVSIFLGKTRLGLRETKVHEIQGKGGGPVQVTAWDLTGLSEEEFALVEKLVEKAATRATDADAGNPPGASVH